MARKLKKSLIDIPFIVRYTSTKVSKVKVGKKEEVAVDWYLVFLLFFLFALRLLFLSQKRGGEIERGKRRGRK